MDTNFHSSHGWLALGRRLLDSCAALAACRPGRSGIGAMAVALFALALSGPALAAPFAYITNYFGNTVSVVDTASNTVVATVPVGSNPFGVAVSPDGARVYVTNFGSSNVSVIAIASNTVVATVPVGSRPYGVAVSPDGAFAYVANFSSSNVSVIATASNTVVATVAVGAGPIAFGRFIGPAATFPFSGFFSPVDNPPTLNAMKAGAAVPVKFSLGGARGLDVIAANFPQSMPVACANGAPVDVVELTLTAGKSSLSYDVATDTYTYAWKTNQAWAGTCRELTVRLSDGSVHKALFQFK